jgi:hypothetical protein
MKNTLKYIFGALTGVFLLASCEINDPINEIARTGDIGPNVYMEIPSANVAAGESVAFQTEYWSVDNQFQSLAIWYSVYANYKYSLTGFLTGYTFSLDSASLARESQEIQPYEHSPSSYNEEKFSYVINDQFPVSYTLATTSIENEETYNQNQVDKLFPASIINSFYEGYFPTLDYDMLQEVMVEENSVMDSATFESHFEIVVTTPDDGGAPVEEKVMKEGSAPVLLASFKQVPLDALIYNPDKFYYQLNYSKSFQLKARFRVVNGNDVENFSDEKTITVN